MPKTQISEQEQKNRIARSIIAKNIELYGLTEEEVAVKCRFTKRTLQNKRKRPESFTLEELRTLCKILHITEEDKTKIL